MPPTTTSSTRRLVIVESPAKAKTIQGYLGSEYVVDSSVGHIRDLPKSGLQVDVDNGFAVSYEVSADKKKKVAELKRELAKADELLLATDEDREGEAIAWHLSEVLKPRVPVRRMVFNEITRDAIRAAAESTRELDMDLVDAQECRRIVDRLYGYEVSPVLWRKIAPGTSAGRVQSVAVRLVVERERERMAFRSASYADVLGVFDPGAFEARLVAIDGTRVASGKDFDDIGRLKSGNVAHLDLPAATGLADALAGTRFTVRSVDEKPGTRRPAPPFMTSTLQQEGSRKLGWNSRRTMAVAQSLYENGWITYMRTDSTTLSQTALVAARRQATELYGADHVSPTPRIYAKKVKNAQEAHEAIRPAGDVFRTPGEAQSQLSGDEFRLYDLIWKRTIASQMVDARTATTTIRLGATTSDGRDVEFSAAGTVLVFAGFQAAYEEGRDDADDANGEARLPRLSQGDVVTATSLTPDDHATKPPARYTEASLVKALEERGIGRPSTYASIMSTIVDRGYVRRRGSALVPSWLAMAVVRLLVEHFGELVDYDFTARMEEVLDAVARGETPRLTVLERFYRGNHGGDFPGLHELLATWGEIDAREISSFPIDGTGTVVRVGRYGPYLDRDGARANVPEDLAPDELTPEVVEELFARPTGDRELGTDPATGRAVIAKDGRFGPYVTEVLPEGTPTKGRGAVKPRTASLFKTMTLDTVTLDDALRLLSLPRVVGVDPSDGAEITAQNGRYGPYLTKGSDSRSIDDEEKLLTITLDEALAVFAAPKQRRGRQAAAPIAVVGNDPETGKEISLREGRFGPYVTDGEYNASLRRADDPTTLTLERAAELLADKRAKGPAPAKKAPRKAAASKAAATPRGTKTPAKKSAATKTAAKKTAAKKTAAKKAAATKTAATAPVGG